MSLIGSSIPNFLNGVSQQAPDVRLPSQGAIQENATSNPSDGLGKRNPTQHIARLLNYVTDWPLAHFYDRDGDEQYVLVFSQEGVGGRVGVWDLEGREYTVNSTLPELSYLDCDTPATELACLTIADTTFVVNKTRKVEMLTGDGSTAINPGFGALVWVKAGNYATTYTVTINGFKFSYTTPDGTTADQASAIKTDAIAAALHNQIKAGLPSNDWHIIYRPGDSVIWINQVKQHPFTAETSDGFNGANLSVIMDKVQKFDDLPAVAHGNMVVTVAGDVTSGDDDYYVRFDCNDPTASVGPGIWAETLAPGAQQVLDPRTMPHILVRQQDPATGQISFTFSKSPWAYRLVGDDKTAPIPSFVGQEINDIVLHRGRLGILAGPQIVLSRASDFYNFWRETVLQILDSDPIDISAATPEVIGLRHAVPLNEELLLFGDRTQEVLKGSDLLTPKTVSTHPATAYEADKRCRPILAENIVYFPFVNGEFSGLREYYVDQQTGKDSDEITKHVPRYIPGSVYHIAASSVLNTMVCLSSGDRQSLYIYQWLWNGNDKIQSAWGRWDLGDTSRVLGAEFIGSSLYLITDRVTNLCLERIDLASRQDPDTNFVTHLDRRITDEQCSNIAYSLRHDTTSWELPYRPVGVPVVASRASADVPMWAPAVLFPATLVTTNPDQPPVVNPPDDGPNAVATIAATQPLASEIGPIPGQFTVFLDRDPQHDVTVRLTWSGTATPGTDYTSLPATVVVPAGSLAVSISVAPLTDATVEETETVVGTIQPDDSYTVGTPAEATVYIQDGTAPEPPPVSPPPPPPAPATCPQTFTVHYQATDIGWNLDSTYNYQDADFPDPNFACSWEGAITNSGKEDWNLPGGGTDFAYIKIYGVPGNWTMVLPSQSGGDTEGPTVWSSHDMGSCPPTDVGAWTKVSQYGVPIHTYALTSIDSSGSVTTCWNAPASPPPPPAGTPTAPSNPSATAINTTRIDVAWTDNSSDEQGFEIWRSYNGTSGWARIGTVPAGITAFPDLPVQPGTTYYYKVRAYNASGFSAFTTVVSAATTGSTPNDLDLRVELHNTGGSTYSVQCGLIDAWWTVDGASAFIHYNTPEPAWVQDNEDRSWISYAPYLNDVLEEADTIRTFSTSVTIGADVDLSAFSLTGDIAVDDTVESVTVNGIDIGVSLNGAGPYWSQIQSFTLPVSFAWRHGLNIVSFKVKNTGHPVVPNPTGLMIQWNQPDVSTMPDSPAVDAEAVPLSVQESIEAAPQNGVVEPPDPNDAVYRIKVRGNLVGKPVWIGDPYAFHYRLSPIVMRSQSGNSQPVALVSGRLQLRNLFINYSNSGYFRAEVTPAFRSTFSSVFADRTVGTPSTRIGEVPSGTGTFRFTVGSKADQVDIDLYNDSILPNWFISANWEGFYVNRSRQV